MITIKQIAEICGVSRGTVDRVINGRGKVKEEKRALILQTMEKYGYQPNPAARALVSQRQSPIVGIIISASEIQFFAPVIRALRKAATYYERFGLRAEWHLLTGYSAADQSAAITSLREKSVEAIIINPISEPNVIQALEECIHNDIFVIALNNDFASDSPHVYVGSDYAAGGRTAAALLRKLRSGSIHAGVIYSGVRMLGHMHRVEGFRERLMVETDCSISAMAASFDDDIKAYENTLEMLEEHPEINAFFIATSGGAHGVSQALVKKGRSKEITVVSFDIIPAVRNAMQSGIIDAAIYQHPRRQGQVAMQIAYDRLISCIEPTHSKYMMANEIRILENL